MEGGGGRGGEGAGGGHRDRGEGGGWWVGRSTEIAEAHVERR